MHQTLSALLDEIITHEVADHARRASLTLLLISAHRLQHYTEAYANAVRMLGKIYRVSLGMPWLAVDLYLLTVSSRTCTDGDREAAKLGGAVFESFLICLTINDHVRLGKCLARFSAHSASDAALAAITDRSKHAFTGNGPWFDRAAHLTLQRLQASSTGMSAVQCEQMLSVFGDLRVRALGL